jgi:long-chain acyl-CoA synthetase
MPPLSRADAIAALTAPGQPYALHDIDVGGRRIRSFVHAPASLRAIYEATATDRPFLVYGDERMSFAQAWEEASRIGAALVGRCGIGRGDRVAIALRNYPEWVLAFTAVTSIGAIAVALNAMWSGEELAYALADCGAKLVFADDERLERLAQRPQPPGLQVVAVRCTPPFALAGAIALAELSRSEGPLPSSSTPSGGGPGKGPGLGALSRNEGPLPSSSTPSGGGPGKGPGLGARGSAGAAMPPAAIGPDDFATIFYTSGSSGHPKGVVSSHRAIVCALLSWELERSIGELVAGVEPPVVADPGTLIAVPLFHTTGLMICLSGYRAQRRLVCMTRWDAEAAAALIERERLTTFTAPAAMTGDLLRVARSGRYDLGSLLSVGGGGAPRAPEQVRQLGATFGRALPATGWGMTETNAIGASISGAEYLARPASSGRCAQVLELKVVDDTGASLPAGRRGELRVRGASLFAGYWRPDGLDTSVFDDGWFRTGDVAVIDADGFVTIVDRIKDLIIRGGENIGCAHVEAALLMHPQVREAAVYAVPDERLGEEVGATVQVSGDVDPDALREFLAAHLARFEIPRYLVTSDAPLPRTPSGKILKRQIRTDALAALQRAGRAAAAAPSETADKGPA